MTSGPVALAELRSVDLFDGIDDEQLGEWLAVAVLLAQVAMIALAPGGGGAYTSLELPGTVARARYLNLRFLIHRPRI